MISSELDTALEEGKKLKRKRKDPVETSSSKKRKTEDTTQSLEETQHFGESSQRLSQEL
jgi:hypothetical protein